MGTNYYLNGYISNDNPNFHIGKRSSNGLYCYNCGIQIPNEEKVCPCCGDIESKIDGIGVSLCCSFTWTKMSHKTNLQRAINSPDKVVIDEYGKTYTAREFFENELDTVVVEHQCYSEFC